jgi:hypothetical protein
VWSASRCGVVTYSWTLRPLDGTIASRNVGHHSPRDAARRPARRVTSNLRLPQKAQPVSSTRTVTSNLRLPQKAQPVFSTKATHQTVRYCSRWLCGNSVQPVTEPSRRVAGILKVSCSASFFLPHDRPTSHTQHIRPFLNQSLFPSLVLEKQEAPKSGHGKSWVRIWAKSLALCFLSPSMQMLVYSLTSPVPYTSLPVHGSLKVRPGLQAVRASESLVEQTVVTIGAGWLQNDSSGICRSYTLHVTAVVSAGATHYTLHVTAVVSPGATHYT